MTIDLNLIDANANKKVADFSIGDVVRVNFKFKEEGVEKSQIFEGIVIARRGRGINSTFTVRKISYGVGVERIFSLYSPTIESIVVVRKSKVRRAKLYYLREKIGKEAKVKELRDSDNSNKEEKNNK